MDDVAELLERDRVLVVGVGGGGDVVGAVPTATLLALHDVDPVLGGLTWERVPHDPSPGPRRLDEVVGIEPLAGSVARASPEAGTAEGVRFAESVAADHLPWPVLLLDPNGGPGTLARGIEGAAEELGVDAVVALDAGGDVIAAGDEEGLRSPLADAVSLAAVAEADLPSLVGVVGWGSDGELGLEALQEAYRRAADGEPIPGAWGVTPAAAEMMAPLLDDVPTEASRIPVEAARGEVGPRAIRDGRRTVDVTPASAVTYYLRLEPVVAQSDTVDLVLGAGSLEEADAALREAGFHTELAYERDWAAQEDGDG